MNLKSRVTKIQYRILVFAFMILLSMTVFSFDSAEAKKSAGTYLNEIGSAKVCGDKMCDAPLSIAEKITEFLKSKAISKRIVEKQIDEISDGNLHLQSAPPEQEYIPKPETTYDVTYIGNYRITESSVAPDKIYFFLELKYKVTTIGLDEHHPTTFEVIKTSANNEPFETLPKLDEFTYYFDYTLNPNSLPIFIMIKKGDTVIETIQVPPEGVLVSSLSIINEVIIEGTVLKK